MKDMSEGYFSASDGTKLFRRTIAPENPRYTVLFEPGFSLDPGYMLPLAEAAANRGLKSVLLTPRGIGRSEGYFDLEKYTQDRKAVINSLHDEGLPIVSMGHSLGSQIAVKQEISLPTGILALVCIETPEDPKKQAKAYAVLDFLLRHKAGRSVLRSNINPLLQYFEKISKEKKKGLLYTIGNMRTYPNEEVATYHDLRLPVGEKNYFISSRISEDAQKCGSVKGVMTAGKFRRLNVPPMLFLGGGRDTRVTAAEVEDIYKHAADLKYRVLYKEIDIDHTLRRDDVIPCDEILDPAAEFIEKVLSADL